MQELKVKNRQAPSLNFSTMISPIIALFTSFALFLIGCESKVKPPITPLGIQQEAPTQESWNTTIKFTDSGKVTGILRAGYIAVFAEKNITRLDSNITDDFYDENEYHTSILTARRGVVNDITHDFEAHDDVVVVSDSGSTLQTQELYWTNATQKIHTPAYVEITSPTEQIQGHGFESDKSLKHYVISKVTGKAKTNK
ncbi:MAG: LPS export ABC transporter periplasmic protein LptC [Ignavibacteriales bacterium]|nr:LPS export ABC transporter periplasmic protein LptC [Ignavibacteriales bacterium]